ncbi:MAG: O-succinylbenzoate synthase [Acidimicrobiia bacterium]|nr:O-succinylbenzoate synthase [Acidimicrobiia bacterium]
MIAEYRLRIGARAVVLLEGPMGWGEYSPLPGYPCDPERAMAAATEAAAEGWPPFVRTTVPVNGLVPATGPLPSASTLADWGTPPTVKLKVGRGDPAGDVRRVAELRDHIGRDARIRVDANGAWDIDTAVATLTAMADSDLEFAEQPVADLDDLGAVRRRVPMPVAADECVRTVADARRLGATGAADLIVLKVQPAGGVRAALAIAAAAAVPAVVTSMFETSIGLAAGLALAAALPELPYACGLATLDAIAGDVTDRPLVPIAGALSIDDHFPPVPTPALLRRYAVAS